MITRENIEKLKTLTVELETLKKEEIVLITKVVEEAKDETKTLEIMIDGMKCSLPIGLALADILKRYDKSDSYEVMKAKYPEMFAKIDEYKAKAKEINEFNLNVMGIEDITLEKIVTLIEDIIDLKKSEEVK
jgi:hypothetical protein